VTNATTQTPILRTAAQGHTVAIVGDVYRFLATGEDTNGKYAMWEAIVPPGGGPPPHVHSREDECSYIIDGEITLSINSERVVATAGMFANLPVGTPHSFTNESNQSAKMIISVAPAGLEHVLRGRSSACRRNNNYLATHEGRDREITGDCASLRHRIQVAKFMSRQF
jgi:quercetin dioxygenase-like cupin family protein